MFAFLIFFRGGSVCRLEGSFHHVNGFLGMFLKSKRERFVRTVDIKNIRKERDGGLCLQLLFVGTEFQLPIA